MSRQRRRGREISFYPTILTVDNRQNETLEPDMDNPIVVRCVETADRSSKGEVPGQVSVEVIRVLVDWDLPNVNLWSRVKYLGRYWDIIAPPSRRNGTRHVKHRTYLLRARPNDGRRSGE